MLKINETFQSIQGEGRSAGQLANFIRVAGCPLKCSWCDTPYSWDWGRHNPKDEVHLMEIDDVIKTLNVKEFRLTILTGGEPLLYQEELGRLVETIWEHDYIYFGHPVMRFDVETAGSLSLEHKFFSLATDQPTMFRFNVSPKLENSGNDKKWAVDDKFMADMCVLGGTLRTWPTMKFVVERPGDFIEIGRFCAHYRIPRHAVYIMGLGVTKDDQLKNMEWIVNHCLQNGYNYSPRLHTLIWGPQRGV